MKTQKITVLLASVILLAAAVAQPQEEAQPATGTRTASCLVKVTCDPEILPLGFETIEYLLCSSGVGGKAASEVLGLSPDESCDLFSIEPLTGQTEEQKIPRARTKKRGLQSPEDERLRQEYEALGMKMPKYARKSYSRGEPDPEPGREEDMMELQAYRRMMGDKPDEPKPPRRVTGRTPPRPARRKTARGAVTPGAIPTAAFAGRTFIFRLKVDLPAETQPRAEEFMGSIINGLRGTVGRAYYEYKGNLESEHSKADELRYDAQRELDLAMGISRTNADIKTRDQLDDSSVDLSIFQPEMSFSEALEVLKNSVDPPLRIVVLWRDLLDNAEVEQTAAINMDPIPSVPLGTALELLLKSVSHGTAELEYVIERGVITIATADSLPKPQDKLLKIMHIDSPREMLLDRKNDLLWKRQSLEMDVARLEARRRAIEEQIVRINEQVHARTQTDPVAAELEPILHELATLQDLYKGLIEQESTVSELYRDALIKVMEKIAATKLALAERRDTLARSAGGEQLARFNSQLAELMVEFAEKEAELQVVSRQLAQTEEQLAAAATFDPQASQIRLAKQALDAAEHRLSEFKIRLANLAEPTVTVLGAD